MLQVKIDTTLIKLNNLNKINKTYDLNIELTIVLVLGYNIIIKVKNTKLDNDLERYYCKIHHWV